MDILLIRHGECHHSSLENYNPEKCCPDPALTYNGRRQAEQLAQRFTGKGIEAIYCSDLIRAVETSQIIDSYTKCGVNIDNTFREINMGEIHLSSWDSFPDYFAEWKLHNDDLKYPGGECGQDVWNRCSIALNSIVKSNASRVAVVTHGGTIRVIICGIIGIPQPKRFQLGAPLECCSVSVIRHSESENKFYLHSFNDNSILV
ncbi:MAG: histidine phosphatase family protein [Parabacteroides sp.]|nr:histidine phosphatase family protein [Parabacteroides sp.]